MSTDRSTQFYWFVELLVQPPKYLRGHHRLCGDNPAFQFTEDPFLADQYSKDQSEVIAKKYREAGLSVEAREHGFIFVSDPPPAVQPAAPMSMETW